MTALAGDEAHPEIATFDPDVGADLYMTNGDTKDHMYKSTKTISFTPEGTAAATGSVFAFLEGVNGSGNRAVLMDRILDHLLQ
jgi:hypothetical protein